MHQLPARCYPSHPLSRLLNLPQLNASLQAWSTDLRVTERSYTNEGNFAEKETQ